MNHQQNDKLQMQFYHIRMKASILFLIFTEV